VIQIDLDDRVAQSVLGRLRRRLQRPDALVRQWAAIVEDEIETSFAREAAPDGSPWAALAPSTLRDRRRQGFSSAPILQRSSEGKRGIRVVTQGTTITVISTKQYMALHNSKSRNQERRQFVPDSDDIERGQTGDRLRQATEAYLNPTFGEFVQGEVDRLPIVGRLFRR